MRVFLSACLALALFLSGALSAQAHRVNIFAYVEGNEVVVECGFNRGSKVKQGFIEVFDAETGKKLLDGATDDNGVFRFPAPAADARSGHGLRIHVDAGEGHQNDWTIDAVELAGTTPDLSVAEAAPTSPDAAAVQNAAPSSPVSAAPPIPPVAGGPASAAPAWATPADVERIVNRALDARLAPVNRMLAEQVEAGPDFADIVGGIGWIFGLIGVAAYFKRRA